MLKTSSIAAALGLAMATGAMAQERPSPANAYNAQRQVREVEANGRCGGISYGTGARRCGTRTGGPVGGISGRN